VRCASCGNELQAGLQRCGSCGTPTLPPPPVGTQPVSFRYEGAESKWPTVLKTLGVVAALAVIAYGISPMFLKVKGSVELSASTPTPADVTTVPVTAAPLTTATSASVPAETGPAVVADPGANIVGITVTASCTARGSTDSAGNPIDFKPENALDGDNATAWRCGGSGVGETLTFTLPAPGTVGVVGALPGYDAIDPHNNDDRFTQNRRISTATWTCLGADGAPVATLDQTFQDARQLQTTSAPGFVGCATVTLAITASTTPGSRDFVALSEVRLAAG